MPAGFVAIEHFGSTAVPGLPAKPVIDQLAGLEDTEQLDAMTDALATLAGYEYVDSLNRGIVGRRWLFRHHRGRRTHQLHLVVHGSSEWVDRLAFRDQLRRDLNLRARYASLKQELRSGMRPNATRTTPASKALFS